MSGQNQDHFLDSSSLLAIVFLLASWFLWDAYMKEKYPHSFAKKGDTQEETLKTKEEEPTKLLKAKTEQKRVQKSFLKEEDLAKEQEFWLRTEKLDLLFSSRGFGIKKVKIKKYYNRAGKEIEFESSSQPLFASSFKQGPLIPFKIEEKMKEGESSKKFLLASYSSKDLEITKEIRVDGFVLDVQTNITPKTKEAIPDWKLAFSQLVPQNKAEGFFKFLMVYGMDSLKGFLLYKKKELERFYELKACESGKQDCHEYSQAEVVALGTKYFGKAFVNQAELLPSVHFTGDDKQIQAEIQYQFLHNRSQELKYQVFIGPKSLKSLETAGPSLKLWLDFGFFSWIARPMLKILTLLYDWCKNWGLAIIILILIIRLFLLPINIKSYQSMKVMQEIQPEIKEIRETYKSEPKKMNEEVMALMKKNKANPLGGCLPMFLQLPILFALYRVLGECVELYQSPFFFWIQDLSLKDPYYVFPILGGLVLFVQQLITPMNLPKEQARLMKIIPLIFSIFMLNLPSGLTIYIFISGLFGLVQQFFFIKTRET